MSSRTSETQSEAPLTWGSKIPFPYGEPQSRLEPVRGTEGKAAAQHTCCSSTLMAREMPLACAARMPLFRSSSKALLSSAEVVRVIRRSWQCWLEAWLYREPQPVSAYEAFKGRTGPT